MNTFDFAGDALVLKPETPRYWRNEKIRAHTQAALLAFLATTTPLEGAALAARSSRSAPAAEEAKRPQGERMTDEAIRQALDAYGLGGGALDRSPRPGVQTLHSVEPLAPLRVVPEKDGTQRVEGLRQFFENGDKIRSKPLSLGALVGSPVVLEGQLPALARAVFDSADKGQWREKDGQPLTAEALTRELVSDKQSEARWLQRIEGMSPLQKALFVQTLNQLCPKALAPHRPVFQMLFVLSGTLAIYDTALPEEKIVLERDLADTLSLAAFFTDPSAKGHTFHMEASADEANLGSPAKPHAYRLADPATLQAHPDLWRYANVVQSAILRAKTGWGNQLRPDQLDGLKMEAVTGLFTKYKADQTLKTFQGLTPDEKNLVLSFHDYAKKELVNEPDDKNLCRVVGAYTRLFPLVAPNQEYVRYYEAHKRPSDHAPHSLGGAKGVIVRLMPKAEPMVASFLELEARKQEILEIAPRIRQEEADKDEEATRFLKGIADRMEAIKKANERK